MRSDAARFAVGVIDLSGVAVNAGSSAAADAPVETARDGEKPEANAKMSLEAVETIGSYLKRQRASKSMSVAEVCRITRIPAVAVEAIENDQFDALPGEVFVRGFLNSYARAVGLAPAEVLARYTASRRVAYVTPLPVQTPLHAARDKKGGRFGVAIAFVLLLLLFTLALSFVLKPRGHDVPAELSLASAPASGLS